MTEETKNKVVEEIKGLSESMGMHFPIFLSSDNGAGKYEVKVREVDSDGEVYHQLFHVEQYVAIAVQYGITTMVMVEHRLAKSNPGTPYFLFF